MHGCLSYFFFTKMCFGWTMKGRLHDGRDVAVKVLSEESRQGDREFMTELSSVSNIRHENLVKLNGGCIEGRRRILVYDYMEHNSLAHVLQGIKFDLTFMPTCIRSIDMSGEIESRPCLQFARGLLILFNILEDRGYNFYKFGSPSIHKL